MEMITLFHGTSSKYRESILTNGLREPYLTDSEELAYYYAETTCEEVGGEPLVLKVTVPTDSLRYDRTAMDEPVVYDGYTEEELLKRVEEMFDRMSEEHPEWVKGDLLYIEEEKAWKYSLEAVGSVRCAITVPPSQNEEY